MRVAEVTGQSLLGKRRKLTILGLTPSAKLHVYFKDSMTDEDVATTLVHETWHTIQPPDMNGRDAEIEAFVKETEFALEKGIAPQSPDWVTNDAVNREAIAKHVDKAYGGKKDIELRFPPVGDQIISNWVCTSLAE